MMRRGAGGMMRGERDGVECIHAQPWGGERSVCD